MRRYYKAPSGSSKIGFLTVGSTLANREREVQKYARDLRLQSRQKRLTF